MQFEPHLTREILFGFLRQEEIFEKYLGTQILLNKKVLNPLRGDRYPTVSFKWFDGTLLMNDQSGWFVGDCISLVAKKIYYCSYQDAIQAIYKDFNLHRYPRTKQAFKVPENVSNEIKVWKKPLEDMDLMWWESHKITPPTLDYYKVSGVRQLNIGKMWYYYNKYDPCYHYDVQEKHKLYFPFRKEWRFFSNIPKDSLIIQGYEQLPDSFEYVVITKSMKDVMCMYEFGIPAISVNSESTMLPDSIIHDLKSRFDRIYINMDYDYAGITMMNKFRKKKDLTNLLFFKGTEVKDFADYCKINNKETIKSFIEQVKQMK